MSKFFDYGDDEPAYYHIKASDMSIYKPKGKVMTFWLWGNSESHIREILSKKDIKDIEWIKKEIPPFV